MKPPTTTTSPETSSDTVREDHDFAAKESSEYPDSGHPAYLETVTVETDETATRVLFELDMETAPSYRAEYVSDPLIASPSGKEIEVAGDADLLVTLTPTAGVDLSGDEAVETFEREDRFSPESSELILEVAETEDFENVVTWAIGLEQETPFAVGFDGDHFVVEFVTGSATSASALVSFTSDPNVSDVDLIAHDGSAIAEKLEGFDLVQISESLRGFVADSAPMFYSSAVAYDADGEEIVRRSVP